MGYTGAIMAARASWLAGGGDVAELTSTVQACVSLWEGAFSSADVTGTDYLDRRTLALLARSLALRGEFVALIRPDRLVPASDWELSTVDGVPRAYRVGIPEAGGARSETVLAGEVLHVRIGSDPVAPWHGTPPLRRSALSANLLHELESALRDTWKDAPIGSQVLPLPDSTPEDMQAMRSAIRGRHGSTLIVEGASQAAAAGQYVQQGNRREDLTPDLHKAEAVAQLEAARGAVAMAFGVLPGLLNPSTTGPMVRECQRHLAQWTLEPLCKLIAEEASEKLGGTITVDVVRPLQAFDVGGKARAVLAMVNAGLPPDAALRLVDVSPDGGASV
jgi:phage portal protein BeeE